MPITVEQSLEIMRQYMRTIAAANALTHAAATDALTAIEKFVKPGGVSPGNGFRSSCQTLVKALIQEARAFPGAVPTETRQAWLKEIEACKGQVPQSEYNEALAILRAGP
jgi:hypothetical protein